MGKLESTNVMDNEILKAVDINGGLTAQITNIGTALQSILETRQDVIIGSRELVTKHSELANDWTINIGPLFGICKSDNTPILNTDSTSLSVVPPSGNARRDIVEVRGVYKTDKEEQRAFIDFNTKTTTLQNVDTRKFLDVEYQIVQNPTSGSVEPPNHTAGWVKIAEISIPENATKIADCTIYNITSDIYGLENENWGNEKTATYNIGYISEINERFRFAHNIDGSHKNKAVKAGEIDIGTGANQLSASSLPINKTIQIGGSSTATTDKISEVINTIGTMLTTIYNNYLIYGTYKFKGKLLLSDIADANNVLTSPLELSADGSGNATVKVNNAVIFTITTDKKLRMATGYTATNALDVVTKSVTDNLSTRITENANAISNLASTTEATRTFANDVLSHIVYKGYVNLATTANINLSGVQSIDGVTASAGDVVLVKNQTDAKLNGIYVVQTGAWNRHTSYTTGDSLTKKLFYPVLGTQAGKFFFIAENNITVGTSNINFKDSIFASANIAGKAVMRDKDGSFSANTIKANCFCGTSTCTDIAKTVDLTNSNNCTCFLPIGFYNDPTAASGAGYSTRVSNALSVYNNSNVAANAQGSTYLQIGNALATSSACNSRGYLRIYGTGATYSQLFAQNPSASNSICLPTGSGELALTSGCVACAGKDGSGCAFGTAARYACTAFLAAGGCAADSAKLGGTAKSGLFTAMSYASNQVSITVGGTTKCVTLGTAAAYACTCFRASSWTPSLVTCACRIVDHGGTATIFCWSGSNSTPTWVWGSNARGTTCVYNPACFTVCCATHATSATTATTATCISVGTASLSSPTYVLGGLSAAGTPIPYATNCLIVKKATSATLANFATSASIAYTLSNINNVMCLGNGIYMTGFCDVCNTRSSADDWDYSFKFWEKGLRDPLTVTRRYCLIKCAGDYSYFSVTISDATATLPVYYWGEYQCSTTCRKVVCGSITSATKCRLGDIYKSVSTASCSCFYFSPIPITQEPSTAVLGAGLILMHSTQKL